jgi:hypothetical protein
MGDFFPFFFSGKKEETLYTYPKNPLTSATGSLHETTDYLKRVIPYHEISQRRRNIE